MFSLTTRRLLPRKSKVVSHSLMLLLAAFISATLTPLSAFAVDGSVLVSCSTSGTFTVTTSGSSVVAKSGSTCAGNAPIPAEVKTIDSFAFANNNSLTSVTFSGSALQSIDQYAFHNTRLTSITIPSGVTSIANDTFTNTGTLAALNFEATSRLQTIGARAFKGVSALTSLTIPASVTSIGDDCFMNDNRLANLTFEAGSLLTSINNGAFSGTALTAVTFPASLRNVTFAAFPDTTTFSVESGNPYIAFQNGVMFNGDLTVLKGYRSSATATSFVIPSSITGIGPNAFQNAKFTSVTIPNSVTSIGTYAFEGSRLTSVTIPASVATIGTYAFSAVANLQSVTFAPGSATTFLSNGSFQNLTNLTSVDFGTGSSLATIDAQAFRSSKLTSVLIPASVEYINDYAFYGSTRLTTVTFEANSRLRQIGDIAFDQAPLSSVTLPAPPVRPHYTFVGWSGSAQGSVVQDPAALVTQHRDLFSLWELTTYPITFDSALGSAVSPSEFRYGSPVSAPVAPTRAGYTFAGWSATEAGSALQFPYSPTADSAITLYALWTRIVPSISAGSTPNSQLATMPAGIISASLPATSELPAVALAFAPTSGSATATVVPIDNPASAAATPFTISSSTKIVDIQVSGVTGPVTVCLDGLSTDKIFHYTGGAWVELPQRTFANGQVCGVTESFSPFAAAAPVVRSATQVKQVPVYTGPQISSRLPRAVNVDGSSEVTISGERMAQVTSVLLEGKPLTIVSKSDSQIVVKAPAHSAGFVDLVLKSDSVSLVFQEAFEYKAPVAARVPVTASKSLVVANAAARSLSSAQQKTLRSFVASANTGAVLNCQATYVSKPDAAVAKSLAADACAVAKKSNSYLTTKVLSPVRVKAKSARTVLLSLTR